MGRYIGTRYFLAFYDVCGTIFLLCMHVFVAQVRSMLIGEFRSSSARWRSPQWKEICKICNRQPANYATESNWPADRADFWFASDRMMLYGIAVDISYGMMFDSHLIFYLRILKLYLHDCSCESARFQFFYLRSNHKQVHKAVIGVTHRLSSIVCGFNGGYRLVPQLDLT